MKYLEKLKRYVNDNLREIPIPGHQLYRKFNVSQSKLEKDFKKQEGITLRNYLIKLKIELARRLKQEDHSIKNIKLMADINYNYTEKSFRNHLKFYGEEIFEDEEVSEFLLTEQNKEVFLEIFIRFILLNKLAEVEMESGTLIINHNVENSIFQFHPVILPTEAEHIYRIFFNVETMGLSYFIFMKKQFDLDENSVYVPKQITPYFNMLYNIEKACEEQHINCKLTDCIKDWDKYVRKCSSITVADYKRYYLEVDTNKDIIKMDRNTLFIEATDKIIDNLKTSLYNDFARVFNNKFGIVLSEFRDYLECVKADNYEGMKYFITGFNDLDAPKIDLLISTISCQYLGDLDIYDYCYYVEESSILESLNRLSKNDLADLLIKLRVAYNNLDEDDYETTVGELLSNILNSV